MISHNHKIQSIGKPFPCLLALLGVIDVLDLILFSFFLVFMQASLKTEREKKKEMYFPLRKYAIKV